MLMEFGNILGRVVLSLTDGTKFCVLLLFSAPTGPSSTTLLLLLFARGLY